jgi:hypothetical protein
MWGRNKLEGDLREILLKDSTRMHPLEKLLGCGVKAELSST